MRQRCLVSTLGLAICLLLGFVSFAHAQATQVKPWFLIVLDTSGSMCESDVNVSNSCGFPKNIKMNAAKCAIQKILNSVGDAEFGLEQFLQNQNCGGATCNTGTPSANGTIRVGVSATGATSILPLVDGVGAPTGNCNNDGTTISNGDNTLELCSGGGTPLGGALQKAREYFNGTFEAAGGLAAPTKADASGIGCRPMSVILLTDGMENCTSSAPADAGSLLTNTFVPRPAAAAACTAASANCVAQPIKTYVIGFGIASGNGAIEAIAEAGGTDNASDGAGGLNGYYASDEATLSAALNQIILDSQLTEVCDGDDDDCDTRVDEGYAKYCDIDARRTTNNGQANLNASFACAGAVCPAVPGVPGNALCAAPEWSSSSTCSPRNLLCTSPGERCDTSDDDCDGRVDEGAAPLIGVSDFCDLVDQDCDGMVDENCNPGSCGPEICDNLDNDCDTRIDEGLGRRCGTDVGDCVAGNQICQAGQWGAVNPMTMAFQVNFCPDTKPATETCNNEDDDCNGIIDRITRACSPYGTTLECTAGVETCVAGVWQSTGVMPSNPAQCIGAKGPTPDICDGKNNDCAATPDGSGDSRVGVGCGNDKGICNLGTTVCTAGNVVCNDPDESQNEICDNLDNDCDGKIDENPAIDPLPRVGTACYPNLPDPPAVIGECRAGTYACVGGSLTCQNFRGPTAEICDSKNNDCDVATPDGAQDPAVGQSCGTDTGECNHGTNICSAGAIACSGRTGPVFELCDGKDNDCDFKTDEDLPDDSPRDGMLDAVTRCDAAGGLMDVGSCDWGQRRCVQTGPASWALQCTGGVGPVLETCDGEDNDCDGTVDECAGAHNSPEYMACVNAMVAGVPVGPLGAGGGKTCGTSVAPCMPGLTKCVADVDPSNGDPTEPGFVCVGGVLGMEEVCNNADDDCDTKVDEELDPANDPRLDVACSDGITIPACREPGDPNEPCGRCKFGHTVCVSGAVACTGALGPSGYEVCNGGDDDCDGDIDECVDLLDATCAPGEVDPNTKVGGVCAAGQCQSGINKCVNGKLECEGSLSGSVEVCNNLDDDCDGSIDEGFNKGAPCTASGMEAVGECRPGMIVCDPDPGSPTGILCINERKPVMEVCNTLDDDCDRVVDEGLGLGDACGRAEGLCEPGKLACVSGRSVCTGEVGPRPETCDCEDNDCDGKIDEDTAEEPVCQLGQCVMCQCALPCAKQMEFATRCPQGKAPIEQEDQCFCVGELCKQSECQASTIEVDGQVRCAPDDSKVGTCLCRNNECSFQCAGVTCEAGLICDPTDGRCRRPTCLLAQFACEDGQRCGLKDNAWSCMDDPCASNSCGAGEACRDGDCVPSCGEVTCPTGKRCIDGACEANLCFGKNCDPGLICNPADGECVLAGQCVGAGCGDGQVCDVVGGQCEEDPCLRTRCPRAEKCNSDTGQCEPRCFGNLLLCDDKCINPMTSRDHCGASEDCAGDEGGVVCAAGLVCSQGTCSDTCADGLINCESECIDPQRDMGHCGASANCQGDNAGALCKTGFSCEAGECKSINPGSGEGGSGGSGKTPDGTRVIASGGGGCTCSVPGAADPVGRDGQRGPLAGLLFALLAIALGRKRFGEFAPPRRRRRQNAENFGLASSAPWRLRLRQLLGALLLAVLLGGSGCKVDTYCLDCPKPGDEPKAGDDGFGGTTGGSGGRGGRGGSGGTTGDGSVAGADGGDAMVMRPDGGCVANELCNGFDDDCDDKVDEGTNPADENIDIDGDALNCGRCGNVCALPHAFNKCVAAACVIDSTQGNNGCDVGFFDLDAENDNGCEYRCTRTLDSDALCDLVDNDCDGEIDEDVDLQTDAANCGACGFRCTFARASAGGICNDGVCTLDSSKCDEGYADPDGQDANGCEYACPVFPVQAELCNFIDDDCDLVIDDGVATSDPQVGAACGISEGACEAGHYECQTGALACVGAVSATVEVCDGIDNDCNGEIDDHRDINLPCGDVVAGSECMQGLFRIPGGLSACAIGPEQQLECFGGQGPVDELCDGLDNDCDGKVDEAVNGVKPEEGQKCINEAGGIQVVLADPDHWTAATICRTGGTVCVAGNLVCRNEVAPEQFEKCDALDHDCDGNPLNGFTFVSGIATAGPDPDLGDACGIDTGECAFGQLRCHQATSRLECDNQTTAVAELCNGKDDDCDGQIDDATPSVPVGVGLPCKIEANGMMTSGAGVTATSPCVVGTTVCAAGKLACPNYTGPTAELCDNVDQDCDGVLAEATFPADSRVNASCDTDGKTLGICNTGEQYCDTSVPASPQIRCRNEVFAGAELCDGLDNDCDGQDDDGSAETWIGQPCKTMPNGSVMLSPPATVGTCRNGMARCVGGRQACELEIGPALETCDATSAADLTNPAYDQDCDGTVDDDFLLSSNVNRCGRCNNDCVPMQPNANMVCTNGTCAISSCKAGYYDSKLVAGPDCSLRDPTNCTFTGQEVCDGKDNDCDALVDESTVAEPMYLPAPNVFCLQLGKCATSATACVTHKIGNPDNVSCTGFSDATCVTEPVCTVRPSSEVCNAPFDQETNATYDDDCDGVSDSLEFNLTAPCASSGTGACATVGNLSCDLTTVASTDTRCVTATGALVAPSPAGTESSCNNADDDCDGDVDEACGMPGTVGSCVSDSWVPLGGGVDIYAYEASRRDATASGGGVNTARACSVAGRVPWGNLTWDAAQTACEAIDPLGRLCTEEEWQRACQGGNDVGTSRCTWSFSTLATCNTYANNTCNGLDFVPAGDPIEPTGWTGTPAMSSTCFRPYAMGNVFDLSGNVKEYVDQRLDDTIPVRGGAYNNTSAGIACGFDFSVWPNPNVAKFPNVGFRCCRGTAAARCVTVKASDTTLPVVAGSGNSSQDDLSSSITVNLPGTTTITDVNVIVTGTHGDFEDVRIITLLSPDGTTATLRNAADNSCTNGVDGFNIHYDDQATPTTLSCTEPIGQGIPTKSQGGSALAAFNGEDPEGTWTITLQDNEGDGSGSGTGDQLNGNWRIETFQLKICGN